MTDHDINVAILSSMFVAVIFMWAWVEKETRNMTPKEKKKFWQDCQDADDWANGVGKFAPKSDSIDDRHGFL